MPSNQQYPVINAGALPGAAVLQSFAPLEAWKTSATTRSTSTQSVDPDLQVTLAANATYDIEAALNYEVSTGGFGFGWTAPAGIAGAYTAVFDLAGTGSSAYGYAWTATPSAGNQSSPNGGMLLQGRIWTGATAGTFGLNWANGTGANSTILGAGSSLSARRIA